MISLFSVLRLCPLCSAPFPSCFASLSLSLPLVTQRTGEVFVSVPMCKPLCPSAVIPRRRPSSLFYNDRKVGPDYLRKRQLTCGNPEARNEVINSRAWRANTCFPRRHEVVAFPRQDEIPFRPPAPTSLSFFERIPITGDEGDTRSVIRCDAGLRSGRLRQVLVNNRSRGCKEYGISTKYDSLSMCFQANI